MGLIFVIIIGAVAGWIASLMMKKQSKGFIINTILGIAGALVGKWAFDFIGLTSNGSWQGELSTAVIGAVIILFIVNKVQGR